MSQTTPAPARVVTVQRAAPETRDVTAARVVPTKPVAPARTATKPKPRHHVHAAPPKHRAAVRLTDVMPLTVDLHPNLGAVAAPLLDHSAIVLAAIALLAAVAAAGVRCCTRSDCAGALVKRLALAALVIALVIVPIAGADGVMYTITSGVVGNNGWYRSAVTVQITATPPTTCPTTATFTTSQSKVDCTWGAQDTAFHLQFNDRCGRADRHRRDHGSSAGRERLVHAPGDGVVRGHRQQLRARVVCSAGVFGPGRRLGERLRAPARTTQAT